MTYSMDILIKDRLAHKYVAPGTSDIYIEGRKGSAYKIKLTNNTSRRALFVVSVDGLSIMDGEKASKESRGYVLKAWQSLDIEGWLVDDNTAARFKFGDKSSSYSEQIGEGTDNTGVIGLLVYPEKKVYPTIAYPTYPPYPPYHWNWEYNKVWYSSPGTPTVTYGRGTSAGAVFNTDSIIGASLNTGASLNNQSSATQFSSTLGNLAYASGASIMSDPLPDVATSLGTEFGEATAFKTVSTTFEKESDIPALQYLVYYATADELNRKGIRMVWQKDTSKKPNAFPGDYCKTPPGWNK